MFFFTVYEFPYFLNTKFEMYTYKHKATFSPIERYKNKRDRYNKHTEIIPFPFGPRYLVALKGAQA